MICDNSFKESAKFPVGKNCENRAETLKFTGWFCGDLHKNLPGNFMTEEKSGASLFRSAPE